MTRNDAANRLERLLRRDLDEAAREAGPPGADEIDAYVEGRANAAEREVIESWLAEDAALQQEVAALMAMRQAIADEAGAATASSTGAAPISGEASAPTAAPASIAASAPATAHASAPTSAPAPASASTRASTSARTSESQRGPQSGRTQTRRAAPGSVNEAARQMRSRPLRTAALLAIAASLAFFILRVASPGRPPVESEVASGGAASPPPAVAPAPAPAPDAATGGRSASPATPDAPTGDRSARSGAAGAGSGTAGSAAANSGTAGSGAPLVGTLALRDAGGEVTLLANGEIRGLDRLDASSRSAIARALASGRLEATTQIDALASSASVLRTPGDTTPPPALRVLKPLATAVRTARPTFEWTVVPGATSYRVRVADAALNPVVESPTLTATATATTTTWTPDAPLPAGRILMWQVEAQTPRGAIAAPAPPAPEARLLVLRTADADALTRELTAANGSDLASAVTLARFGLLDEADAALARLAAANPEADAITRMRRQLSDRRFPR